MGKPCGSTRAIHKNGGKNTTSFVFSIDFVEAGTILSLSDSAKNLRGVKMMGKFLVMNVPSGIKFDLVAGNGEIIGISEVYSGESACHKGIESVRKNAVEGKLEDQTVDGFEAVTCPKFEIYKDKAGEFRFRLLARNGENILASQGYTAKESCKNGIESVRKNAPEAPIVKEEQ